MASLPTIVRVTKELDATPATKFPKFRSLPMELQLMIWEFAANSIRRVVKANAIGLSYKAGMGMEKVIISTLNHSLDSSSGWSNLLQKTSTPALLHTCQISRKVATRNFQWHSPDIDLRRTHKSKVNPKRKGSHYCVGVNDIIKIEAIKSSITFVWNIPFEADFCNFTSSHIKILAFNFRLWSLLISTLSDSLVGTRDFNITRSRLEMPNLEEILIVVGRDTFVYRLAERWMIRKGSEDLDMIFYEGPLLSDSLERDMLGVKQNGRLILETRKEKLRDGEKPLVIRLVTEKELCSMSR